MILFWIICAVLLVVALLFVVLPLWRSSANANDVLRDAANLEILRDQSAELEADLRNGLLTQDAYEQGKRELQARLLDEVKTTEQPAKLQRSPARILAVALAVSLPLFSVLLYLTIGNSKALLQQEQHAVAGDFGVLRSEAALQELEKKLEKLPENPDGWLVLARSYSEMQRYPDAVRAYGKLVELVPGEAQLWANYADVSAMSNNQSLLGEPTKFLNRALELDSNNSMALALAGSAAMERGDYAAAITHWTKLVHALPPESPDLQMITDGIRQAREFLKLQKGGKEKLAQGGDQAPKQAVVNQAAAVTGKVVLSAALAGKAAPTDTVFIVARAVEGPRMPLAVLRKQVQDLPLQFTLDDSMAMQPQARLSSFDRIEVVARISRSGNPISQPGDLQGTTGIIKPGAKVLNIAIDTVIK